VIRITSIVGARPNFMKVAPLHRAFGQMPDRIQSTVIHTGQHFDEKMSQVFFDELELPVPDHFLGVGQGSHSVITARIMLGLEPILINSRPDLLIVVGDVTSTLAAALVANRLRIPVAHVEAGLRSMDREMPEEINRLLTDQISDYLFITEQSAQSNLLLENIPQEKIFFTGNCMIDSLAFYKERSSDPELPARYGVRAGEYMLMTMHRPSNVDDREGLQKIIRILQRICNQRQVIFPMHPRTRNKLESLRLWDEMNAINGLILTEPLAYLEFINLMRWSALLLTDSGGVQEETTYLGIPCVTFRRTTERPVTVEIGSNILMSDLDEEVTVRTVNDILEGKVKRGSIPPFWDGQAAVRIRDIILQKFS